MDLLPELRASVKASGKCVVVLDDDPTGTQTVYQTPVLTTWGVDALVDQLRRDDAMFYILTNSRALPERDAVELARTLGRNLREASAVTGRDVSVISRSDSTLRGHYPAEVDAVAESLGHPDAIHVIMPFFLQGGRLTIGDTHYVAEGDVLVPAAETPFAKDATFGFSHSNLRDWVFEKSGGAVDRSALHSVSIDDLRRGDLDALAARIAALPPGSVVIVNAVEIADARAFALAARKAERSGAELVYRTAASFVQAYAGLDEMPLLRSEQMIASENEAGLIVVGSYVPKTTTQLEHLLAADDPPQAVVLDVGQLLSERAAEHLAEVAGRVNMLLDQGQDVVLHTSRGLVTGSDGESSLRIGTTVSKAVVEVVRATEVPLRFLIAKGGITSSDVATKGLDVRRAIVLGQILPGIPVWSLGPESRRPELPYVVFPGNVGGDDALALAYKKLHCQREA
nr:four-carbon acid sugar kinase family protein [Rhodopirellula sp. JC639]